MKKPIYLKIETDNGIITIPFLGIQEVDNFTVMYRNMGELGNRLIKLLNLPINLCDVIGIYLSYDKYGRYNDDSFFKIKYMGDNFNFESLKEAFATYLKNDPKRIFSTDIRYLKTDGILKYFGTGLIDAYEIENAVRIFFAKGTGYKRKRDTYFLIKDDVYVKIDEVSLEPVEKKDRDNLSLYSEGGDDYLSYLIELSKKGEEEYERAMDEIGQSDLEDISRFLKRNYYGIVDGVSSDFNIRDREIASLEENTGLSLDDLRTNNVSFGRKRRSRK